MSEKMKRKMKSYTKYCGKIARLEVKGKVSACYASSRMDYWFHRIATGEDNVYGRLFLIVNRASRGIAVVLPKELT